MAKRLPNRCVSEIGPRNDQNLCHFHDISSRLPELSLCASPSLKHVIKPNVVKMRKEAFEQISKDELSAAMKRLSVVDEKASRGRQVKSDSSIELASSQGGAAKAQETLRSSENVVNLPSGTKLTTKKDFGGVSFQKPKLTMSCSVTPSETNGSGRESTLSRREKPQVQPKPKRLLSSGFPRHTDSPAESQHFPSSPEDSDVFLVNTKDAEKKLDSPDLKVLESEPNQLQKPSLPLRPDITSLPIPPPKPPRSLSEMSSPLDEGGHNSFADLDVDNNGNRYDCLTNTVSVVLPAVIPEMQPAGEVMTPHIWNSPEAKVTSEYEELEDVIPAPAEVKKPVKGKKESGWGSKFFRSHVKKNSGHSKTLKLDNPNYGLLTDSDTERPLARHSSDNALDRWKTTPAKELIYDVPYMVTGMVTTESQDCDSVCDSVSFDEAGYAIPDFENQAAKKQSKARSKVSHAYNILRLPNETGDTTQIEDADNDDEEHEKHLLYVKSVRQYTSAAIAKYEQVKLMSAVRLFQYGMIIGLEDSKPKVTFCLPPQIPASDSFVCNFCFPDADMLEPTTEYEGELFSFVLTSETGDRRYGWCKRYLPPGVGPRFPEALCIVSPIGEFGMYEQLLRTLQEYRSHSIDCAVELIEVAYARPMPGPNREVYIRTEIPEQGRQTIILKRASESAHSAVPFTQLLEQLPVSLLIEVFGAILMERKVIFCASRLSTLSSCICAMVALLYPFEWQHTFVTVLPTSLIDVVDAPTPYIVGILSSLKPYLEDFDLAEVLLVDLDEHSTMNGFGDESRIIPKKLQKALTTALTEDSDRVASDATVREAFLRFFLETCSHYMDFIIRPEDDENTFQREQFVKAVSSRGIRLFLEWFTQTQMFEVFMSGKLNQNASSGYFEQQIAEYREEMETYKHKRGRKKAISKKISAFFKSVIK